jgi:hypothetical protein
MKVFWCPRYCSQGSAWTLPKVLDLNLQAKDFRFASSHPRATPAVKEGAKLWLFRVPKTWKYIISCGFSDTLGPLLPSTCRLLRCGALSCAPAALRFGAPSSRATAASSGSPPASAVVPRVVSRSAAGPYQPLLRTRQRPLVPAVGADDLAVDDRQAAPANAAML